MVIDLRTDLRNGLVLISLASELTQQVIDPAYSSTNTLEERIENISLALSGLRHGHLEISAQNGK